MGKSLIILIFLTFGDACIGQECCADRWWQKENPSPGYNQKYNPDYLSLKRELEIKCDHFRDFIRVTENIIRDSGRPADPVTLSAIADSEREIRILEHELSQISIFIELNIIPIEEHNYIPDELHNPHIQNQNYHEVYYTPIEEEYYQHADSSFQSKPNRATSDTTIVD